MKNADELEPEKDEDQRIWGMPVPDLKVALVSGVLLLAVAAVLTGVLSGDDDQGKGFRKQPGEAPDSVENAVANRSFWTGSPTIFDTGTLAPITFDGLTEEIYPPMESIRTLVEQAGDMGGQNVLTAGRVVETQSIDPDFLPDEYRLIGTDPRFDLYVGVDDPAGISNAFAGDVVYVYGRLVAIGDTETIDGAKERSAYVYVGDVDERSGVVPDQFINDDDTLQKVDISSIQRELDDVAANTSGKSKP